MDKVIIIDASQILTIMRRSGVTGLSVLLRRGEYFFFSDDLKQELIDGGEWDSKNGKLFQKWRQEQRVNGRLLEVDTRVSIEKYETYDFGKRGTSRGGKELSDMSIRKFMLQNKHRFTFELISRDLELLDHRVDNPKHPLYGLQFDRLSTRSALTWLATHPDVPLNPERLRSLLKAIQDGKFDLSKKRGIATHELEREKYHLPETYADAFQAHVNVARQRRRAELEREDRERAKQYGIDWPETRDTKPFEVARTRLLHAATLPELRQQPTDKKAVDAKPAAQPAPKTEPTDGPQPGISVRPMPGVQPMPRAKPQAGTISH